MRGRTETVQRPDLSYKPKYKLRKGNSYTQSRLKLQVVVDALTETVNSELDELEAAKAKEVVSDASTPVPVVFFVLPPAIPTSASSSSPLFALCDHG
jgi:hypothetical protein